MRQGVVLVLATVLPLAASPAAAASSMLFDGHALAETCSDGSLYYTYGKCAGYIVGVHDQYADDIGELNPICLRFEEHETADVLIDPVVAYLDANPAELGEPAAALVLRALRASYPCQ